MAASVAEPNRRAGPTLLFAGAIVAALAWTAFLARLHVAGLSSPLDRFEEVSLDLRYVLAPRRAVPDDVVLVTLDDETIRRAGAFPLPRPMLGTLVAAIARQKPRAIAIDVLFLDPGRAEIDAALGETLQPLPVVVAAAGLFGGGDTRAPPSGGQPAITEPSRIQWPIEPIARAAEVGLVNLSTGYGGVPRHVPLLFRGDKGLVPPSSSWRSRSRQATRRNSTAAA